MSQQPDHVFIIAEAGVNHNGDLELAKKLVKAAAEAGADAVKFQTFQAEAIVTTSASKAKYQKQTTDADESQYEMLKRLELSREDFQILKKHCTVNSIMFMSTPFDLKSIGMLVEMGLEIFKIPSGEITNLPYLRKMGSLGKKLILSTGMSTLDEVQEAVKILTMAGTPRENITVLHCTTEYPAPFNDINLQAMETLQNRLGMKVGYSDHTSGIEVPIAAVALGAKVIEKHFTLDKTMDGPDHKASLDPTELKKMVTAIRHIELAIGGSEKKPTDPELANRNVARKSIVAAAPIAKGELFTETNLTTKRPATGISPMQWDTVIGKAAPRDFTQDELITL
ncbi:MAG: N-acetylneuraminate synthase [Desulfobulbaceae bacterium]|nr:N-acetylneuraminate synthase [Desulfobulbaceae bacterium]